jgi:WhiB family transcriptional regulator, redox-sensing transcriptional regulator
VAESGRQGGSLPAFLGPVDGLAGWERLAACRDHDPLLFFGPTGDEPKRDRQVREATAKAVCGGCPALEPCRAHALDHAEPFGVWGGLGELDRRAMLTRGRVATAV